MRPILIEIASEECSHEQRHHGHWLAKMRQFRFQSHVRLIVGVAMNREIGGLYSYQRADLRGYALIVGESFAEYHGLTGK